MAKLMEFVQKNKAGAIIGGTYFLFSYYVLGAKTSVTTDKLGLGGTFLGSYGFLIDLIVAVLVATLIQSMVERKNK